VADISELCDVLAVVLRGWGVTDSIEECVVEGLRDEPGFHWSNPGVCSVAFQAGGKQYRCVMKRLGQHSKREVPIYRFLSAFTEFPMPKLYYAMFDDVSEDYWFLIEQCVAYPSATQASVFWEQVGRLLGHIHGRFWGRADSLPRVFHLRRPRETPRCLLDALLTDVKSLDGRSAEIVRQEIGLSSQVTFSASARADGEFSVVKSSSVKCLVHGAFHAPEIMWRLVSGKYDPVAVDWEKSRVGWPEDDLAVCGSLLAEGREELASILMQTYFTSLSSYEVCPDCNVILEASREAGLALKLKTSRWILRQYLKMREEESYGEWLRWAREELRLSLEWVSDEMGIARLIA